MSLPLSFQTQSLGELVLQDDRQSYRPTNQNAYRFLFVAEGSPESWTALIDQRCPHLNSNWPSILAQNPAYLREALAAGGKVEKDMKLKHLTMQGSEKAILLISLGDSESEVSLEVILDGQDALLSAELTR